MLARSGRSTAGQSAHIGRPKESRRFSGDSARGGPSKRSTCASHNGRSGRSESPLSTGVNAQIQGASKRSLSYTSPVKLHELAAALTTDKGMEGLESHPSCTLDNAMPRPTLGSRISISPLASPTQAIRSLSINSAGGTHSRRRPLRTAKFRGEYEALAFGMHQMQQPRLTAIRAVDHPFFDRFIILLIGANCVFLAVWDPTESPCSPKNQFLELAEVVFLALFSIEMMFKLTALGPKTDGFGYFSDRWNWLDFLVVLSGWFTLVTVLAGAGFGSCGDAEGAGSVSSIRVVRMLRPLRAINGLPQLREIVSALITSFQQLVNVLWLCTFIFFVFGILGLQLFRGKLRNRCQKDPQSATSGEDFADNICSMTGAGSAFSCPEGWTCVDVGENPSASYGIVNFDNIGSAFLVIFQCITLEGWTDVMYDMHDAVGVYADIYFVVLVLIGSLFVLNVIIAVIYASFVSGRGEPTTAGAMIRQLEDQATAHVRAQRAYHTKRLRDDVALCKSLLVHMYEHGRGKRLNLTRGEIERWEIDVLAHSKGNKSFRHSNELALEHFNGSDTSEEDEAATDGDATWSSKVTVASKTINKTVSLLVSLMLGSLFDERWFPNENSSKIRRKAHELALSRCFHIWTICIIVMNTIALCAEEYRDADLQPLKADVLHWLNIMFTICFTFEMLVKMVAFTPRGYATDPANIFDAIIVTVGLSEFAVSSEGGGAAALRTFRLLRIFKLAQNWKSLNRILRTMFRTLGSVLPFTVILVLFVFIFTLLGMQLFGGKFDYSYVKTPCISDPVEQARLQQEECTINAERKYVENLGANCFPPRANYDSFFSGFVTTFIVLTGENWNEIMYDAIKHVSWTVGVIYFITFIFIGNYMLLNLVVAILIDKFTDHNEAAVARKGKDTDRIADVASGGTVGDADDALESASKLEAGRRAGNEQMEQSSMMSLYIFSADSRIRQVANRIVRNKTFEGIVLTLIGASCVTIALDEPGAGGHGPQGSLKEALNVLDWCFTSFFCVEVMLKLIVYGGFMHKGSYFRSPWNCLDALIASVSIISLLMGVLASGGSSLSSIKALRALRALRPLRMISRLPGLKIAIDSIFQSIPPCSEVAMILVLFFLVFGILGFNVFKGQLGECNDCTRMCDPAFEDSPWCRPNSTSLARPCSGNFTDLRDNSTVKERVWSNPTYGGNGAAYSFDNVASSTIVFFEVATLEMWLEAMWRTVDATKPGFSAERNNNLSAVIVYIAFIILLNFFLLNLFVSVVIDHFQRARKEHGSSSFMTPEQREWVKVQKMLDMVHTIEAHSLIRPPRQHWRRPFYAIIMDAKGRFDVFIMLMIIANVILMACTYEGETEAHKYRLEIANYIFLTVFWAEAVIKVVGIGLKAYTKILWNRFDCSILVIDTIFLVLEKVYSASLGIDVTLLRIVRIARVLRLVRTNRGLLRLFRTLYYSLPSLGNVGMLLLLFLFVFACIGMNLFGGICYNHAEDRYDTNECEFISRHVNFDTTARSMITLFRMLTGESWNAIMRDCAAQTSAFAGVYFVLFIIVGGFTLLNLFVAVILENFEMSKGSAADKDVDQASLMEYRRLWKGLRKKARANMLLGDLACHARAVALQTGGTSLRNFSDVVFAGIAQTEINEYDREARLQQMVGELKHIQQDTEDEDESKRGECAKSLDRASPGADIDVDDILGAEGTQSWQRFRRASQRAKSTWRISAKNALAGVAAGAAAPATAAAHKVAGVASEAGNRVAGAATATVRAAGAALPTAVSERVANTANRFASTAQMVSTALHLRRRSRAPHLTDRKLTVLNNPNYLPAEFVKALLEELEPPLGLKGKNVMRVCRLLAIPCTISGFVHYRDTLNSLIRLSFGALDSLESDVHNQFECPFTAAEIFAARIVQYHWKRTNAKRMRVKFGTLSSTAMAARQIRQSLKDRAMRISASARDAKKNVCDEENGSAAELSANNAVATKSTRTAKVHHPLQLSMQADKRSSHKKDPYAVSPLSDAARRRAARRASDLASAHIMVSAASSCHDADAGMDAHANVDADVSADDSESKDESGPYAFTSAQSPATRRRIAREASDASLLRDVTVTRAGSGANALVSDLSAKKEGDGGDNASEADHEQLQPVVGGLLQEVLHDSKIDDAKGGQSYRTVVVEREESMDAAVSSHKKDPYAVSPLSDAARRRAARRASDLASAHIMVSAASSCHDADAGMDAHANVDADVSADDSESKDESGPYAFTSAQSPATRRRIAREASDASLLRDVTVTRAGSGANALVPVSE